MPSKPPDPPPKRSQTILPGGSGPKVMNNRADLYTDSVVTLDPATKAKMQQAAPEVSQGLWRERATKPRAQMTREDVEVGMRGALKEAGLSRAPMAELNASLKADWLPFVRQVVEQTAGDGLDALLCALLGKPAKVWKDRPLIELVAHYRVLNQATTREELNAAAETLIAYALKVLEDPARQKISFKILERDLEGRLELEELISILTSTDVQLEVRTKHVKETLDILRDDIRRGIPGQQPNGILWNFTRFKAERILLDAEHRRRVTPPSP